LYLCNSVAVSKWQLKKIKPFIILQHETLHFILGYFNLYNMDNFIWCFSCKEMKPTRLFEATRYLSRGFEQCCIKCNDELFKREAIRTRTNEANRKARKVVEANMLKADAKEFKEIQRLKELDRNRYFISKEKDRRNN